ncbi:oxidoreductase-like domain-containing protein [Motiliproteus sp.]|uniref:oxidoreductase-like domain-containing protein n=1 Tax=Motiliproteus sp. TaxID=1898955 RepID=UPI003BAD1123
MPELLEKPVRPKGHECCGGGCCPCIWDHYYDALGRWEEQQEKLQQQQQTESAEAEQTQA